MLHGLYDLVDGLEGGVDGAVAQADRLELLLAALEADGAGGGGEVGGMDGEPVQLVAVGFLLHPAGVADQGLQIVVGNGLLLVAEGLEPDEEGSQLLLAQLVAQLLEPGLEGVVAGVLAQHQVVGTDAHGFRREDFIGLLIGQHAVLVDAALVEEGILAHDGLVQGRGLADDIIDGLAGPVNLGGVDAGGGVEDIGAGAQGHDHLF